MSFEAVAWAVKAGHGRGLSWPAKGVLWHLANRFNPDKGKGCFPSQKCLAADCEVSQSQLNVHLATLEKAGLIRRVLQFDPKTGSRMPTRYRLAFEEGFEPISQAVAPSEDKQPDLPLPPVQNPEIGVGCDDDNPAPPTPISVTPLLRLAGVVLEAEPVNLETVNCVEDDDEAEINRAFYQFWDAHPRARNRDATLRLFRQAVHAGEYAAAIIAAARRYAQEQAGNRTMYLCQSDNWLTQGRWRDGGGEDNQEEPRTVGGRVGQPDAAEFWASQINQGAFVPTSAIGTALAHEMLQRCLVTSDQLRGIGVYA
jgi:DNA-binding transcriptional ArsR family regulator